MLSSLFLSPLFRAHASVVICSLIGGAYSAEGYAKVSFKDDVAAVTKKFGIPLIDFGALLDQDADPGRIHYPGSHFNEAGCRAVAELVERFPTETYPSPALSPR